jgi:pimeloyl-ACP methyl ester carboxylesterase
MQMKRWWSLVLMLGVLVAGLAPASAAQPAPPDKESILSAIDPRAGARAQARERAAAAPNASTTPGGAAVMAAASLVLEPCDDDPIFLCGTLPVPLDRRDPGAQVVNLHVEVYPHTGPRATARGAVFVTEGGPGFSASLARYDFAFYLLEAVARDHDLVFIDQRGVGLSDVIDCPDLQDEGIFATPELYPAAARCHDSLGDAANLYATVDVADDLEDVRQALGYGRINIIGASYAGGDAITYTMHYPQNVRSVVVADPAAVDLVEGPAGFFAEAAPGVSDIVGSICSRSPACAAANPDPEGTLATLAAQLRGQPFSGIGVDSMGVAHQVTVDEALLATGIARYEAGFVGPGEITPAASALATGDPVPLLRLAADLHPDSFFYGDPAPREFSFGHGVARTCVDFPLQWDKDEPDPAVRRAQFDAAVAAQPPFFGPFSREAWATQGNLQPAWCISSTWEDRPAFAPGTTVSGVPALVIHGEYDTGLPEAYSRFAAEILDGEHVTMASAGHAAWWWSPCGPELVDQFIRARRVVDASCAEEPAYSPWIPGGYPLTVTSAPSATQVGGPPANTATSRLATAVAWTAMDGLKHNFIVPGDSAGLRGGVVDWDPIEEPDFFLARWFFEDVRFTADLGVSGEITGLSNTLEGELVAEGPGDRRTRVRFSIPGFESPGAEMTLVFGIGANARTFTVPAH